MAERAKTASLKHEREYLRAGCRIIVGIDEAGRGPLAGPVAAAAVALPLQRADLAKRLRGARDSKTMSPPERARLSETIKDLALAWGVGSSAASEIDRVGIVAATKQAVLRALDAAMNQSGIAPDCLFLDYLLLPERRDLPQVSLVDGDARSLSIACASVLAKTWRDQQMIAADARDPRYGFARHKGYGTAEHLRALREHGPCDLHRRSFQPLRAQYAAGAGSQTSRAD